MSQETQSVVDDEAQMAQALSELRQAKDGSVEAAQAPQPQAPAQQAELPSADGSAQGQPPSESAPAAQQDATKSLEDTIAAERAELHRLRSEVGRVGALNRKYMQAAQEAAELRQRLEQFQQPQAPATGTPPPADSGQALDRLAEVAKQVEQFPELAGIVAAVSDAIKQTDKKAEAVARHAAAQMVEPLEPLRREHLSRAQHEQQAAFDAALQTFNTTYPTAPQVVESDDFNAWIVTQPPYLQQAFRRGETPMDALAVMDAYDAHLRRSGRVPVAQISQSQTQEQGASAARAAPDASRLHRAAGLPSRPSGAQGSAPPPDDFDASLAYFRSKRLAAQRSAA